MAFLGLATFGLCFLGAGEVTLPGGNVVILERVVSQDTINSIYAIVGVLDDAGVGTDILKEIVLTLPAILESGIGTDTINELLVAMNITDLSIGLDQIDLVKFFNILKLLAKVKFSSNITTNQLDSLDIQTNQKEILDVITNMFK